MKDLIINLFGVYEPITYAAISSDGTIQTVIPSGVSGVDWVYVLGVVGFFLVFYCLLRLLVVFFNRS